MSSFFCMFRMCIFVEIGEIRNEDSSSEKAQNLVKKLQNFIANNYYNCSNEILLCLGKMYAVGGEFTDNIDRVGGRNCKFNE